MHKQDASQHGPATDGEPSDLGPRDRWGAEYASNDDPAFIDDQSDTREAEPKGCTNHARDRDRNASFARNHERQPSQQQAEGRSAPTAELNRARPVQR
jgi:hypothetical protein